MADRITDERLREIVADEDDYAEAQSMAAELLAARAEVERLRQDAQFHKGVGENWAELLTSSVKEADVLRRDLAEAIYLLRMFGFCTEADPDHELLLVERRQKLLDRHP